jgi:SAM-dependent methyltransferase
MPNDSKVIRIENNGRKSYWVDPESFVGNSNSLCNHARSKLLYSELAPIFDLAIARNTEREVTFLDEVIRKFLPRASKVLDLGCGVGRHDEILSRVHKYKVTGIDISKRMIELAETRCPECKFFIMDIRNIKFKGKFDVALCMWTTFNYISGYKDVKNLFRAIHKVLAKDGLFIIDMNNYGRPENSSYNRRTANDEYEVSLKVTKKRIDNMNEALYSYHVKDLKTGKENTFLDQELNMIYSLEDVVNAAKPFFALLYCFGDYNVVNKFDSLRSDRIVIVLKKKGSNL